MELLDQDRQYKPAVVGMMIVVTTVVLAVKKCPYGGIQSAFCYFPISNVAYHQMESCFAAEPLKHGL